MKFKVHHALESDVFRNDIWITPMKGIKSKDLIIISNRNNRIYTIARIVDDFYLSRRGEGKSRGNAVYLSQYHRDELGISTNAQIDLTVKRLSLLDPRRILVLLKHPDYVIRYTVILAYVSIALSVIGFIDTFRKYFF